MTTIAEDARQVKVRGAGRTALRAAYVLSAAVGGLVLAASSAGLFVEGLYPDGPWAREAFRAGDLATMALVAPALIASLIMSARGSTRATLVWMGMLGYSVYNYAYYVFGAVFNDIFLFHVSLFSISFFALVCALRGLNSASLSGRFLPRSLAARVDVGARGRAAPSDEADRVRYGNGGQRVRRRLPDQPDGLWGVPGERGRPRGEGLSAREHHPDRRVRGGIGDPAPCC